MMGYASHLVVEVADQNLSSATSQTALTALGMYYAQLAMNYAWMPLFFSGECRAEYNEARQGEARRDERNGRRVTIGRRSGV